MTAARCSACGDTGELNGPGFLDCYSCDAAIKRDALNQFTAALGVMLSMQDRAWAIYQYAQSQVTPATVKSDVGSAAVVQEPVAWLVFAEDHNGMVPQFPAYEAKLQATRYASMFGLTTTEVRPLFAIAPASAVATIVEQDMLVEAIFTAAEEWSNYVEVDSAPTTLIKYLEKARDAAIANGEKI